MAARKARKKTTRRKKVEPASRGLAPEEVALAEEPELDALAEAVEKAQGTVLAGYRDPLGGRPLLLAALPLARVAPTPFQRDLSEAHAKRLAKVIDEVGVFLDPVIAVRAPEGSEGDARFWSPNGHHRLNALARLGAKAVTVLLAADPALAYRILALNTEKAHTVKERALEAVRMARGLAEVDPAAPESRFALELEEPALVTLGRCYEERARFAGGAYAPALRQSDAFLEVGIAEALETRGKRAERLLAIDDRVSEIIAALKERGFDNPYLRNFVVARIRPFVRRGAEAPEADALLDQMEAKAAKFDVAKVRADRVGRAAGGGDD